MTILALTDSTNPWHSFWIRFGQYAPDLNLEIVISNHPKAIEDLVSGDTLFLYRYRIEWGEIANSLPELRKRKVHIIADVDDYLWKAPGWDGERIINYTKALRECHKITCSTHSLKELLEIMFPKQKVLLAPNSTPPIRTKNSCDVHSHLKLCWTGAPWTRPEDLRILQPLAKWLNDQTFNIVWRHIGYAEGRLSFAEAIGVRPENVETLPILPHKDYLDAIEGHIGLAPLNKDTFNEFKSELKLLEFSGLGIPWIASDVTPYRELCERWGWKGRLCQKPSEWIVHLKALLDENIRDREGAALKQLSHSQQSYKQSVFFWDQLLASVKIKN